MVEIVFSTFVNDTKIAADFINIQNLIFSAIKKPIYPDIRADIFYFHLFFFIPFNLISSGGIVPLFSYQCT